MTIAIANPAALIAEALGINADGRVRLEITREGWDNAQCEETGAPGAILVEWTIRDYDEGGYQITDRTLSSQVAGDYINAVISSEDTNEYATILVKVAHQWIRFVHPELADMANWLAGPTRIAA